MPNAVEDALNRASSEQRQKNQQVIEEARRNIKLVSVNQSVDLSSTDAATISHNAQVIEDAKRSIPFETMQDVDSIAPPLATPPNNNGVYNSTVIELHPNTQSTIESIEQGGGNNYLNENAVDRALVRQEQETHIHQEEKRRATMGR